MDPHHRCRAAGGFQLLQTPHRSEETASDRLFGELDDRFALETRLQVGGNGGREGQFDLGEGLRGGLRVSNEAGRREPRDRRGLEKRRLGGAAVDGGGGGRNVGAGSKPSAIGSDGNSRGERGRRDRNRNGGTTADRGGGRWRGGWRKCVRTVSRTSWRKERSRWQVGTTMDRRGRCGIRTERSTTLDGSRDSCSGADGIGRQRRPTISFWLIAQLAG